VLSAVVSRGSSGAHAHNEEDMLSLVKEQLLRQQLLMEGEEQLLFKHEAKNINNIECSPKIHIQYRIQSKNLKRPKSHVVDRHPT
jgi:hypothetical protein